MKSRTDSLNELFTRWENEFDEYSGKFKKDGINNEDLFKLAKYKILYITKEPNNPNQAGGDYREWWKEGIKYGFSQRISEWSYGILNDFPPIDNFRRDSEKLLNALHSVAFMNIKKTGGKGNSNYKEMMRHLEMNIKNLHKQIDIIAPDIIITGIINWKDFRTKLFPNTKWIESGFSIAIGRSGKAKVIDFYHPSSRNAPAASYSLLQNVIQSKPFQQL